MCMKCLPTCVFGNLWDIFIPHLSHVPQHGEDDKPRHKAGQAVHGAGDQSISATEDLTLIRDLTHLHLLERVCNLLVHNLDKLLEKLGEYKEKMSSRFERKREKSPTTRDYFFFSNPYRCCNISLPLDWILDVSWCFKRIGITTWILKNWEFYFKI